MASLAKTVMMKIVADDKDAEAKLDAITLKADELEKKHPELKVKIDTAAASAKLAVFREELKRTAKDVSDIGNGAGGGGLFSSFFGDINSAGQAAVPLVGNVYGLAAAIAAVGALLPELTGIVSGLAAAGAGVGAFGLLALPTFKKIATAYTSITTAQKAYSNALALDKENPTKTNATAAAAALVKLKVAQEAVTGSTRTAVDGIQHLIGSFDKLAASFAPDAMKVFNSALQVASTLLPDLRPFATAAATAIGGLLQKVNVFFASADFKKWLGSFQKLAGPALTAIGQGIGQLAIQAGKLLTTMSAKDVVNAIHIAFTVIGTSIHGVTLLVSGLMKAWDFFEKSFIIDVGFIVNAAARAFGWLPGIGPKLKRAAAQFDAFEANILGGLGNIQATSQTTSNALATLAQTALDAFSKASGAGSQHGIGGAAPHAAGGLASGLSLVGERGAELVRVPGGSFVYDNGQTRRMLGSLASGGRAQPATGSGGLTIEFHVPSGGAMLSQQFWTEFANGIRIRGGSPGIVTRKVVLA